MQQEWFSTWFNSPYYHILYKNRNQQEATTFIQKLVDHLQLQQGNSVLDMACGKGRHSNTLAQLGMDTIGVDLSKNSIAHAQQQQHANLQFFVHDMRRVLYSNYFDAVFNLFTSFGYFKQMRHNTLAAHAMVAGAKPNGYIVIDFINAQRAITNIGTGLNEQKIIDNITFNTHKHTTATHIYKTIHFVDADGDAHNYTEEVQALNKDQLIDLFTTAGATLVNTFGNHNLDAFNITESPRLILVFKKNM